MVCKKSVSAILEMPSPSQMRTIAENMNETTEEKLLHNERLLYEWIRCQNHFPSNIDKGFVRAILRGCKHNLEKAKRIIEQHLSARHLFPDVYEKRSPLNKDLVQAMDVLNILTIPKYTEDGYRINFFSLERYDPSEFNMLTAIKLFFMLYELFVSSAYPACGDIAVFDGGHFGAAHLVKFSGPVFRTLDTLLRNAYAIRLKQIHIINAPPMLGKFLTIIRPIMHQKVRNSIFIHKTPEEFVNTFGPDLVPSDYGGNLKSVRSLALECYGIMIDNADWFEAQENVKITGIPKKIERSLYFRDELGVEGSFRKLEID